MHKYLKLDPWCLIEEGFNPANHRNSESLFSIGNGFLGQRANFEEHYSGDFLAGNYVGGVYYPDKTRFSWWKIGYPAYYAKVPNIPNWIHLNIEIGKEVLDLAKCKVSKFIRTLDMQKGFLERTFEAEFSDGKIIKVHARRFISLLDNEIGALKYSITPLNFSGEIKITLEMDGKVKNEDTNYGEKFVDVIDQKILFGEGYIITKTRKSEFSMCTGMLYEIFKNDQKIHFTGDIIDGDESIANIVKINVTEGEEISIYKYGAVTSTLNYAKDKLIDACLKSLHKALQKGYALLLAEQIKAWADVWQNSDVIIEGDLAAQQAIRFNIFQLRQTYNGDDSRLNVGPKGFTGEKYGGSTYWDTEALCLPFYMATAGEKVAKNLLLYRYNHLQKAIENAAKLGFTNGAALYPMVTVTGEECHNEWEITFEEIHRNGAIAYAIYNYVNYTKDKNYLVDYGLEVLIAISRFWKQRSTFSQVKNKYVILGVTGPNEYENNVDNNWHTNNIACWTLKYTIESIEFVKKNNPNKFNELISKLKFNEKEETATWQDIVQNMYFPIDEKLGIFLQQEGYLDKEQLLVKDLEPKERPINQYWSWDRILRSVFIKQADVLQGLYFFADVYDKETIKKNFDFYEPRTVHESSLSPCVYAIMAARIGYLEKAYELYLRATRLDLDDYNHEVKEGCHITSMAGSWLVVAHGFGGMIVKNGDLHFEPTIPANWISYSFKVLFREHLLKIKVSKDQIEIFNESAKQIILWVLGSKYNISGHTCEMIKIYL